MSAIADARVAGGVLDLVAVRDIAPAILGVAPFGVVVGVAVAEAGVGLAGGTAGSFAIYSGSAQMTVLGLLASGAGPVAIMLTLALTNARLLVYGAALAPSFRHQPAWFRWLAPQVIVDQTVALSMARAELATAPRQFRRYWLTAGGILTVGWLGAVGLGMIVGPVLPPGSPLEVAMPALFIGLTVPKLHSPGTRLPAVVAALVATLCIGLPRGSGVIVAIVAGGIVAALRTAPHHGPEASGDEEDGS